jgi:Leucine-rich repeat (LRR) protein
MKYLAFLLLIFSTSGAEKFSEISISCTYSVSVPYTCDLTINNPDGFDNFTQISGNHVGNRQDSDVSSIYGYNQNTVNVPVILCQQFVNVREIYLQLSNIRVITERSVENCGNLQILQILQNHLQTIPDNIFVNNPNLHTVSLYANEIQEIGENTFTGSQIQALYLDYNSLRRVNPRWFDPIRGDFEF